MTHTFEMQLFKCFAASRWALIWAPAPGGTTGRCLRGPRLHGATATRLSRGPRPPAARRGPWYCPSRGGVITSPRWAVIAPNGPSKIQNTPPEIVPRWPTVGPNPPGSLPRRSSGRSPTRSVTVSVKSTDVRKRLRYHSLEVSLC